MKKQTAQTPKPKTLVERYIDHLETEVRILRTAEDFLAGKIERLELALMEYKNEATQNYVARTDRPSFSEVPIEKKPQKKDFNAIRRQWNDLSAEEQEKAIREGSFEVEAPE